LSGRSDESEVRHLHDRFCGAFAARDAEAVLETVADRPDVAVVTSEESVLRGLDELRSFVERYIGGPTTYSWSWESQAVSVSGSFAWLIALGTETATSGGTRQQAEYRMTAVAEKEAGTWRFVQVHGSSPHQV
jgi:uncharacterized protein (TIGR02246 family)